MTRDSGSTATPCRCWKARGGTAWMREERGLAEGRAEGRAEGAEAERHEMARRLLEAGVDKATIKFVTGMDEETLSGLCK